MFNPSINLLGRRNIKISKCELDINFKESDELMLVSKYPISKEEALKYDAKDITITNNSTCDTAYYKLTIKDLNNSSINKDKINYQLIDKSDNSETVDKNPDNFLVQDSLTKGNSKSYSIRIWIDESATNTDLYENGDTTKPIEYKYALTIESSDEDIDSDLDKSGANVPELTSNMIPVYYDETSGIWRKADATNKKSNWYNYDKKKWANAITVNESSGKCSNPEYTTKESCLNATKVVPARCSLEGYSNKSDCESASSNFCVNNDNILNLPPSQILCLGAGYKIESINGTWNEETTINAGYTWISHDRNYYLESDIGTEIPMSDINTMWVWIPRYTYTYFDSTSPQAIKIKFEQKTESTGTIKCTDNVSGSGSTSETCTDETNKGLTAETSTYTHPAFTFGDQELTGIWVGKFINSAIITPTANSTTESTIIIKPDQEALKNKALVYQFRDARQMEKANNIYGFPQNSSTTFNYNGEITNDNNSLDTHTMKNTEWGAVTYLYHSKYGRCNGNNCERISINNSTDNHTGRSGGSTNAVPLTSSGSYKYFTSEGQTSSTTGNIYGIYDMSGGLPEYTMSNMVDENGLFNSVCGLEWSSTLIPLAKYYDSYTYAATSDNYYKRGRLGDATIEIANHNWYSFVNLSTMPNLVYAATVRNTTNYKDNASPFPVSGVLECVNDYGSRSVLIIN